MSDMALISEAFVKAQGELKAATFDSKNPFLKNRYASLGAVIAASRPVLAKHGLGITQVLTTPDDDHLCVRTSLIHSSGQQIDGGTLSMKLFEEKGKSKAQVLGSCATYLKRYAWASVLGIYADEDTDGNGHSEPENHVAPRDEYIPTEPAPEPLPKTDQTRMRALNALQAAPGQPNRELVSRYLSAKKQVAVDGEPESWVLDYVPNTPRLVRELGVAIATWEAEQKEGAK